MLVKMLALHSQNGVGHGTYFMGLLLIKKLYTQSTYLLRVLGIEPRAGFVYAE